jgi:hypothetical protein
MYFKLSQSLLDRSRHCELRSSEAIQNRHNPCLDCFPLLRQGSYLVATIPTGSTCQNRRREAQPRTNLGEDSYEGTDNLFLSPYVAMFRELRTLGCTFTNMEKSLCTYSIPSFRDNLIAKHPGLITQITNVISSRL